MNPPRDRFPSPHELFAQHGYPEYVDHEAESHDRKGANQLFCHDFGWQTLLFPRPAKLSILPVLSNEAST